MQEFQEAKPSLINPILWHTVAAPPVCTLPSAVFNVVGLLDVFMDSNSAELRSFSLTICILAPKSTTNSFLRLSCWRSQEYPFLRGRVECTFVVCRGIKPCTSYSRTNDYVKLWLRHCVQLYAQQHHAWAKRDEQHEHRRAHGRAQYAVLSTLRAAHWCTMVSHRTCGSSPPCTRHPIHACAPVCCVLVVFSSPVLSSTSSHRSPSSPSWCLPQSSTRGPGPTPCATSAWGPWSHLTMRHPHIVLFEFVNMSGKIPCLASGASLLSFSLFMGPVLKFQGERTSLMRIFDLLTSRRLWIVLFESLPRLFVSGFSGPVSWTGEQRESSRPASRSLENPLHQLIELILTRPKNQPTEQFVACALSRIFLKRKFSVFAVRPCSSAVLPPAL